MAFSEDTANRIREILLDKGFDFYEKAMFGGLCFMVNDKMCCATRIDKKTGEDLLMCRVGEDVYDTVMESNYALPMQFTGKVMRGFLYITEDGFKSNKDLNDWLQLCLDYNPIANRSKKK